MHRTIARAIRELRRTREWGQEELAREICRNGRRGMRAPDQPVISRWEGGQHAPAPQYRMALARVAATHKATQSLVPIFNASTVGWELVWQVQVLYAKGERADS